MALHWTPFSYVHISCTGSSDVADCPLEETGFLLCTCVYRNSVPYTLENKFASSMCLFFNSFAGKELEVFVKTTR